MARKSDTEVKERFGATYVYVLTVGARQKKIACRSPEIPGVASGRHGEKKGVGKRSEGVNREERGESEKRTFTRHKRTSSWARRKRKPKKRF